MLDLDEVVGVRHDLIDVLVRSGNLVDDVLVLAALDVLRLLRQILGGERGSRPRERIGVVDRPDSERFRAKTRNPRLA